MPFAIIRSPKDILQLQNNIESIFVANVLERRRLAIGEALAKAKDTKEISKLIDSRIALNTGLDFVWQQGLFAGTQHAEKEIDTQLSQSANFSLSYGFQEIIEFAKRKKPSKEERIENEIKEIDGQIERSAAILRQDNDSNDHLVAARLRKDIANVTDQDRENYRQELTNEIQSAVVRREKLLGTNEALAKTKSEAIEEPRETTVESNLRKQKRKEQARLRRAWERRKKTFDKIAKQQSKLNEAEKSQNLHDLSMSRLGLTTQKEINNTLNNRYSALSTGEQFSQTYLRQRQRVLTQKENSIIQADVRDRVASFIAEYKTDSNQKRLLNDLSEMYRGTNNSEYTAMLSTLQNKRTRLQRDNALGEDEVTRLQIELGEIETGEEGLEINLDIARQEKEQTGEVSEETREILTDLRRRRKDLRENIRNLSRKRANKEAQIEESINRGENRSEQLQSEVESLRDLLAGGGRKAVIDEVFPGLPSAERTDETLKEARKLLRKRLREKRNVSKQLDRRLRQQRRSLDQGNFTVSRTKGKTTQLSEAEQAELVKLLKLTSPEEIAKLSQPMTASALEKLRDRLKRRRDVFSDETAAQSATRLAATEVSAAYNLGRLQVFLEKNIRYVQWIAEIDSKTSVFCQSLHRKVFLLEDIISQIMFAKSFPKTRKTSSDPENIAINPSGNWVPPAHPYCRSYLQPVYLKEDEEKVKADIKSEALQSELILDSEIEEVGISAVNELQKVKAKEKTRLINKTKLANGLFNSGLSFLLRRLRQDKIADFTVEEVKKSDNQLIGALLGGAASLTATSMIYFFLKGNLSNAITAYAQNIMSDVYEGGKEFLAGMTKAEAAKVVNEISQEIKALPPSVLEEFRVPLDLEKLKVPEFEIDKLAKRGEAGFGLAMQGLEVDEVAESLLSNNQLKINSGKAFKDKIYKEVLNKTTSELSSLRRQGFDVINQGFGELGIVGDIKDVQGFRAWPIGLNVNPSLVYVQPKPGKGKEFAIGAKKFNNVIGRKDFTDKLDNIGSRSKQLEKVLKDLDKNIDADDVINKARIKRSLAELGNLSRLSSQLKGAKAAPLLSKTSKALDEVFDADILTNKKLADFNTGIEAISNAGNEVIEEFTQYLPPEKIMNLVAENITDVSELKSIDEVLDAAVKNIKRNFLITRKDKFRVRKIQNLKDLKNNLSLLEQVQNELANSPAQLEFQPTLDRINKVVNQEVSSEYNKLLKKKLEVERRLKQLEP